MADAAASADRGNVGRKRKVLVEKVIEAAAATGKHLSKKQASDHVGRTLLPRAKRLKILDGEKSAQSTTSMRSMINPRQQKRWHLLVNCTRQELRELSTDDGSGVRFADVEDFFWGNFDEEGLQGDNGGSIKVIAAWGRRKHKKEMGTRTSITLFNVIFACASSRTQRRGSSG